MLKVSQSMAIQLTRGDNATLNVTITNETSGEPYEISEKDIIEMTVRKKPCKDSDIMFHKKVVGNQSIIINPEDTTQMPYGDYVYDIQLTTEAGNVYTVIPPRTFRITPEVTM